MEGFLSCGPETSSKGTSGSVHPSPGTWSRVTVVSECQLRTVSDGETLVVWGHPLGVGLEVGQGNAEVEGRAVEEDGDEGVGGAGVGDHLLGEEDVVHNLLVLDVQFLILHNLPPASPVIYPPEQEDGSVTLSSFNQRFSLQIIDFFHL